MITLFRRFRQKLIDSGSVTKYLLYAIGEILLVVIGILIALQVNNWNEEVKAGNELNQYLQTIQSNIQADQEVLDSLIVLRREIIEQSKKAQLSFLNKEFDFTTTRYGLRAYLDFYFAPNTSGYEALKNSPYLARINETDLNALLVEYNSIIKLISQAEKSYNEFVENLEVEMASETDRSLMMAYVFMEPEELAATKTTEEEIVASFREIYESSGYRNIVSQSVRNEANIVALYIELKETGLEIIRSIEEFTHD